MFIVIGVNFFVGLCNFMAEKYDNYKSYKKEQLYSQQILDNLETAPQYFERRFSVCEEYILYIKSKYLLNISSSLNKKSKLIIEKRKKIYEEKLFPIKEIGEKLYSALQFGYSSMLSESDWSNLDLIIYYLETNRADTIKEALQLLDEEIRTQRIEQSISRASDGIRQMLGVGFASLQKSLSVSYDALSNQLNNISIGIAAENAISAQLVSSVELNNALQAKANENSAKLLQEAKRLKS